ncbi:MAG: insulinase family protein [Nitrospirae bacterium]|nr:insulinase family protein [Nitrospirota bacterium]MBI5694886.1 insulinase family protein [Nitrospirota bacterium]
MTQKFRAAIIAAIIVLTTTASAFAVGFDGVKEYTLDNGLKVLLLEEHKSPVAVFQIWYKVGSRYEPYDKAGISHMLEHMMFKGTKKYGPKTFSKTVQRYGGSDNAFTSQDYTAYFQTFASDRIGLSLDLESDRMKGLMLDEKDFLSERDVVAEERRMRTDTDPESALGELVQSAAFQTHPYRWPIIGWMDTIQNFTVEDAQRHYDTYYEPNNATIVIVGDIDADKMILDIKDKFGGIKRGPEPPKVIMTEPVQKGERRVTLKKEAQLPTIYVLYHTPNQDDPDTYALDVLEVVMSGGKSSRLYKSLVYDRQIAQYAGAGYSSVSKDPETFTLYAGVMPEKPVGEVEQAIYAEIEKLKTDAVSDRELQKAKNQIESSFIMGLDSNFNRAMMIGRYESVSSWKLLNTYLDGIRAVTADDVRRVAAKYLTKDNRTVGVLEPLPIGEGEDAPMPGGGGGHGMGVH